MRRNQGSRRDPLTVDEIIDCALALIDEHGLEAFSMRRLGSALGVDPMAIYHHVESKQTVIMLVVDRVLSGIEPPDPTMSWEEQIKTWARSYRAVVTAHPALTLEAIVNPSAARESAARATAALRNAMRESGATRTQLSHHCDLVVDFVHGAALGAATIPPTDTTQQRRLRRSFDAGIATIIEGIRIDNQT